MKLITFTVPCYNSQDYMRHCIDSLLVGGEDVEIIIVNDGSKDSTGAIADEYAEAYPSIVKVVHKENGGHGTGVNAGVHNATGLYFKVVDSDDWLEESALKTLLTTIKQHIAVHNLPDMYVCNFVYFHAADNTEFVSDYTSKFGEGFIDWKKAKSFHSAHTMMMHALIYNTEKLREHYIELPAHTFYVDHVIAYVPLAYMLNSYYLNVNLYYYYIGREGQSINIQTAIGRYKQQITVQKLLCDAHKYDFLKTLPKGLKKYMYHYLHAVTMETLMFSYGKNTKERRQDVKAMWRYIKASDKKLYKLVRYRGYPLSVALLPRFMRAKVMMFAYNMICKKYKLG